MNIQNEVNLITRRISKDFFQCKAIKEINDQKIWLKTFSGKEVRYNFENGLLYRNDHRMNKREDTIEDFLLIYFDQNGDSINTELFQNMNNELDTLSVSFVEYYIIYKHKEKLYDIKNSVMFRNPQNNLVLSREMR